MKLQYYSSAREYPSDLWQGLELQIVLLIQIKLHRLIRKSIKPKPRPSGEHGFETRWLGEYRRSEDLGVHAMSHKNTDM